MNGFSRERLYNLLPAIYRIKDADQGYPLRALLSVIESELDRVEDDIRSLYDNWFIETCKEWVVPYLGDLLAVRNLHPLGSDVFSQRAYVANTLAYRRRKGTPTMLEQLARDVTGWPAKAVEFFQLLGTTQYLNHLRPQRGGVADLRDVNGLQLINGPFEHAAHTVDVRHIDRGRGRYNIPNVGLFLWRLQDYPLERVEAYPVVEAGSGRYTFHPLGEDIPLFNLPRTETTITQLAAEANVPGPLRRRPLYEELEVQRQALTDEKTEEDVLKESTYFGAQPVFRVFKEGVEIKSVEMLICNLSTWQLPPATKGYNKTPKPKPKPTDPNPPDRTFPIGVSVDPVLGRLAFPSGITPDRVEVSYAYGFSGDMGGGPYERRGSSSESDSSVSPDTVANPSALNLLIKVPSGQATLADGLDAWTAAGSKPAVIEIEDNATYQGLTIQMTGEELVIQAANRRRPALIGDLVVTGGSSEARLTLSGLLISGNLRLEGTLGKLRIVHCTLALGTSLDEKRITVEPPNDSLQITIDHSMVGPLRLPVQMAGLTVNDSIIQAPGSDGIAVAADDHGMRPGPPSSFERTTVFGRVHVTQLTLASEVMFDSPVTAERHQAGCVRFSYVPPGSQTPRRFRCQPELALIKRAQELGLDSPSHLPVAESSFILARVRPSFTTRQAGQPAYGQLRERSAEEIRNGAEDGSEMGAFSNLKQPQREANLRASLDEYLRFGLEAGIFYVT